MRKGDYIYIYIYIIYIYKDKHERDGVKAGYYWSNNQLCNKSHNWMFKINNEN